MKKLALCAFLCSLIYSSLHAQTSPRVISYQGLLRPAGSMTGSQIAGNRLLTVTLYGDADGTVKLWQSAMNTLIDSSGVFNCMLGTPDNPLPEATALDRPIWVGIAVGSSAEMRPLAQFTAAPYALNVADSSITSSKLNMNYVSSISVNGQPITGQGTNLNIVSGDGVNVFWDATEGTLMLSGAGSNTGAGGGDHILSIADTIAFWSGGTALKGPSANSVHLLLHGDPGGGSGSPTWSAVNLLTDVTDTLQQSNGGTDGIPKWGGFVAGTNTATDSISVVAGGSVGDADNFAATVGGGFYNSAYGDDAVVSGGEANWVGNTAKDPNSYHSAIGGGAANTALGIGTAIPGGVSLKLGSHSFGFNGDSVFASPPYHDDPTVPYMATITDLSATGANLQQVAYFGNVNMMIGNVDDAARQIQFYSPNNHYNYSGAHYTSFQAGGQTANIYYTLPTTAPDSLGWVLGIGGASGPNIQLQWQRMDTGSGGGGIPAWYLSGNTGTTPGPNFLGTIDDTPFEIHIDNSGASTGGNQRVMRYSVGATSPNLLGGSSANTLGTGLSGSAILSGGTTLSPNIISDSFAVITGGAGNVIDTAGTYSTISGGRNNFINGPFSTIAGGDSNTIADWAADHNVIGGGLRNTEIDPSFGTIGGGAYNYLSEDSWATMIGGGWFDSVFAPMAFIGSGWLNKVDTFGTNAVIGGGERNRIESGSHSIIVGGYENQTAGPYTMLGGGYIDTVLAAHAFLGGGLHNVIDWNSDTSVLVGGARNWIGGGTLGFLGGGANDSIKTPFSVVVGGQQNIIETSDSGWSVIVGGLRNKITGSRSFIGGGYTDSVNAQYAVLVGGYGNHALSEYSMLGGGYGNSVQNSSDYASLVGGLTNNIGPKGTLSFIGGGQQNSALSSGSVIPGGLLNVIDTNCTLSVIAGGGENVIAGNRTGWFTRPTDVVIVNYAAGYSNIAGGVFNNVYAGQGTVLGGQGNTVDSFAVFSSIAGGATNTVRAPESAIGGGFNNLIADTSATDATISGGDDNQITGDAPNAAIPGGVGLTAQSFDQFVAGRYNVAQGTSTASAINGDDALAIWGNGTHLLASNAVTFSNNGHSTVYQTLQQANGSILTTIPSVGSTYTNNTIVAEADVPAGGSHIAPPMSIGVDSVIETTSTSGIYVVFVHTNKPGTENPDTLHNAIITVTIVDNSSDLAAGNCGYATCSEIGHPNPSEFIVRTYPGGGGSTCTGGPLPFFFHLTGKE